MASIIAAVNAVKRRLRDTAGFIQGMVGSWLQVTIRRSGIG